MTRFGGRLAYLSQSTQDGKGKGGNKKKGVKKKKRKKKERKISSAPSRVIGCRASHAGFFFWGWEFPRLAENFRGGSAALGIDCDC